MEEKIASFIADPSTGDFDTLMREVFAFQRVANPAYGRFCSRFPEPVSWKEIPAVPQTAFKHTALRSFPESLTCRTFRTSGTTGEGFGEHHFASLRLYELAVRHGWDRAGLGHPVDICLMSSSKASPYSSLSQMGEWLVVDSGAFLIRDGKLETEPFRQSPGEKRLIFGTALAFLHLIETGEQYHLHEDSVLVETGGYKGTGRDLAREDLHRMMAETFGTRRIFNEYGMTELSSQFYAGPDGIHRCPPWAQVLVVHPATGRVVDVNEAGVVKIFDLANIGSVVAILTEDLAVRLEDGFRLLGRNPRALPRGCSRSADELLRGAEQA